MKIKINDQNYLTKKNKKCFNLPFLLFYMIEIYKFKNAY